MTAEEIEKISEKVRKKQMKQDDRAAKKAIRKAAKEGLNCVDVSWISSECEKDLKSKGFDIEEHRQLLGEVYYTILWGQDK